MRSLFVALFTLFLANPAFAIEEVPASRSDVTLSFAPVVKHVVPAVVNIFTKHTEKVQASPLFNDPFFNQFFGQNMGAMPRERVVQSLGSGVIVGEDGTIVTSYHVVKGSDTITIVLNDRRELEGHVEKIDENMDLAVLKVNTKGIKLPTLTLRDSDTLEVGDLVLAVGNPFGVGQTVTSGIISALARSSSDISDYQFFIQTDAAINPGNSGGALVDMQGRLIGINTAIYSRTGGYQGIGFAIPANMVRAVLKGQVGKSGAIIQPYFGVAVQPVTQEVAEAQGLDLPRGVLVQAVSPKSPAELAGIKPGDIITELAGGAVNDSQSLNFRISTTGIGVQVEVKLWRAGKEITLPVTFTEPPAALEGRRTVLKGDNPLRGAVVSMLTPDIARELNLTSKEPYVVVLKGNEDNGDGMTVNPGDVIVAVGGKPVHSIAELEHALAQHSRSFAITLVRGGVVLNMTVER